MVKPPGDPSICVTCSKSVLVQAVLAGNLARNFNVALGGKRRQQVEFLEDEANLLLAHLRALRIRQLGKIRAVDRHAAEVARVSPPRI